MAFQKKELIYEGKAKKIFSTTQSDVLLTEFKNSLTAFNAKKRGSFDGKGEINLKITTLVFSELNKNGIPTHFIENLDPTLMAVKKLKMIPLEVVVRNRAAGSFSQRFGIPEGKPFEEPIVEFYYKNDALNDPLLTDAHVVALKVATLSEIQILKTEALRINNVLKRMFREADMSLVDFKVEFGKNASGEIILGDEISPDSCRLWDVSTGERLDKDRFRRDLGKVQESYELILSRLEKRMVK